jgi:hypothetical protein
MDWRTRLAVVYKAGDGPDVTISPIDSFTPTFSLSAEILHSIQETHIGVIYNTQSLTFSMTVRAIGDVAAQLTTLALNGTRFDITLQEFDGNDWAFSKIVMSDCIITSASPSNATINGAPSATFSGVSLGASVEDKASNLTTVPPWPQEG